jgi:hypothetical protein
VWQTTVLWYTQPRFGENRFISQRNGYEVAAKWWHHTNCKNRTKEMKLFKRTKIHLGYRLPLRDIFKQRAEAHKKSLTLTVVSDEVKSAPVQQTEHLLNSTFAVMAECGLIQYLETRNKSAQECKTISSRWCRFINWSYIKENKVPITPTVAKVSEWAGLLIGQKYDLLLQYSSFLQNQQRLAPTTVRNYISDIESCCVWVTVFAPSSFRQSVSSFEGITRVAQLVRTNQAQLNRRKRSHITMAEKVRLSQLPPGGLRDLQQAVAKELPWARSVRHQNIDDVAYGRFMQVMFAALYVFSPNGRQSGVVDIKLQQVDEFLAQYFTTSTQFKTHSKFGYQPVTLETISHELLSRYVTLIRPQVRRHDLEDTTKEALWLTYRGVPEVDVGRLVTRFFTRTCGLAVTITAIRALVETTMHRKNKEGKITDAQRAAVQNINGHSSETTKAYYLLEDRTEDVLCSRGALIEDIDDVTGNDYDATDDVHYSRSALMDELSDKMSELAEDLTDDELNTRNCPLPLPLTLSPRSTQSTLVALRSPPPLPPPRVCLSRVHTPILQHMDWGTEHPDYGITTKGTAIWTDAEKQFLGQWCTNYRTNYPEVKSVVAKCLHHIRTNPSAIKIFHKHHILNSARLRNGVRQYEKELEADKRTRMMRTTIYDDYSEEAW